MDPLARALLPARIHSLSASLCRTPPPRYVHTIWFTGQAHSRPGLTWPIVVAVDGRRSRWGTFLFPGTGQNWFGASISRDLRQPVAAPQRSNPVLHAPFTRTPSHTLSALARPSCSPIPPVDLLAPLTPTHRLLHARPPRHRRLSRTWRLRPIQHRRILCVETPTPHRPQGAGAEEPTPRSFATSCRPCPPSRTFALSAHRSTIRSTAALHAQSMTPHSHSPAGAPGHAHLVTRPTLPPPTPCPHRGSPPAGTPGRALGPPVRFGAWRPTHQASPGPGRVEGTPRGGQGVRAQPDRQAPLSRGGSYTHLRAARSGARYRVGVRCT